MREGCLKTRNKNKSTPVLILSAHAIALGVVRSLGGKGIPLYLVSYEKTDMAHKSKYIRETFFLPHPEKNTDEFIKGLLGIGEKIGRAVVFAVDDPTLTVLSKNHDVLKSAFLFPSPGWSVIKRVINKDLTYEIAEREGIPYPKTMRLDISAPLRTELLQEFTFPFLIKPVQSHTYYDAFKVKMTVVSDMEALEAEFSRCRERQIDITVQEIILGNARQGFNFNSLCYNGRIQQGFTAHKIRMTANGYGVPTVVKSCEMVDKLREYSETLLTAIGYEGYSCIEYKYDERDGLYKLLEVNGRYNRSSLLSFKLGINFPWLEYNHLINGRSIAQHSYQKGVYYIDEFKDLQVNMKSLLRGKQNICAFLRPYFSRRVFAVFSLRDLAPFLKHALDGVKLTF